MKQRKSRREQQKLEESFVITYLKPVGIGVGIGIVVTGLLLFLFSLLLTIQDFPKGIILPFCA